MTFRMTLFFCSLVTLAIVHFVSMEFFLYWKYLWLDIPMHVLGGITSALGFSVLPFFRITMNERYTTFVWYALFVLMIGLFWEIFEVVSHISVFEPGFLQDTITDLIMDLVGAGIGYGIAKSSKTLSK